MKPICEWTIDGEPCPNEYYGNGMCHMHYQRHRRGMDMDAPRSKRGRPKGKRGAEKSTPVQVGLEDHPLYQYWKDGTFDD